MGDKIESKKIRQRGEGSRLSPGHLGVIETPETAAAEIADEIGLSRS